MNEKATENVDCSLTEICWLLVGWQSSTLNEFNSHLELSSGDISLVTKSLARIIAKFEPEQFKVLRGSMKNAQRNLDCGSRLNTDL